jgi:hypothetical protein
MFLRRQRSNFFLKNTIDNPSCTCDAIELITNLYCTDQYSAIRQQFTFSLQFIIPERISSDILLLDCNIVLADENIMLFINVQSCFLQGRRFM